MLQLATKLNARIVMDMVHTVVVPLMTTVVNLRAHTIEGSGVARYEVRDGVPITNGIAHPVCNVAHVEDIVQIRFAPLLDVAPCLVDAKCCKSSD